jgi:hypothetical protein
VEFVGQKVVVFKNNKSIETLMQHFQKVYVVAFVFKYIFEGNGFAVDVISATGFEGSFGYHGKNLGRRRYCEDKGRSK